MDTVHDIAIIGGGFSGLAVLANIVRLASRPLSIIVISRDDPARFGPAYSTPRAEHLLNVRAEGMGLFDDDHAGFYEWAVHRNPSVRRDDYLPRRLYAEYLADVRKQTFSQAAEKSISMTFLQAEVEDVNLASALQIVTDKNKVLARDIVLAIGNTLRAKEEPQTGTRLVTEVWSYDYEALEKNPDIKNVTIIGSGLTALDSITSLLKSSWQGKLTCISGSAQLPRPHPPAYEKEKLKAALRADFIGKRPSQILKSLRRLPGARGADWAYAIDSLRHLTQDIWKALSPEDRLRASQKYFNLWNIHRHRCDAGIRRLADDAMKSGRLTMVKARCIGLQADEKGVTVSLQQGKAARDERFDLVFKCIGVNYAVANNPLLTTLLHKGLLKGAGNPYGISADAHFRAHESSSGIIHALGTPLFGQLFETTAVPELRHQAARVAADVIALREGLSQSRAAGAGE